MQLKSIKGNICGCFFEELDRNTFLEDQTALLMEFGEKFGLKNYLQLILLTN